MVIQWRRRLEEFGGGLKSPIIIDLFWWVEKEKKEYLFTKKKRNKGIFTTNYNVTHAILRLH